MKLTTLAFGGVVAAGLFAAAPAFAGPMGYPSTPAEKQQTADLNAQSLAYARAGENPTAFNDNLNANTSAAPAQPAAPSSDNTPDNGM